MPTVPSRDCSRELFDPTCSSSDAGQDPGQGHLLQGEGTARGKGETRLAPLTFEAQMLVLWLMTERNDLITSDRGEVESGKDEALA